MSGLTHRGNGTLQTKMGGWTGIRQFGGGECGFVPLTRAFYIYLQEVPSDKNRSNLQRCKFAQH